MTTSVSVAINGLVFKLSSSFYPATKLEKKKYPSSDSTGSQQQNVNIGLRLNGVRR